MTKLEKKFLNLLEKSLHANTNLFQLGYNQRYLGYNNNWSLKVL
jgi:hypothetical protein